MNNPLGCPAPGTTRTRGRRTATLAGIVVLLCAGLSLGWGQSPDTRKPLPPGVTPPARPTALVELTVPANWPTQRVVAGPGSARVQVTSPSDPEVALHVTQSPVPEETLGDTAERLKRAIDTEPDGVFVDFNPSGNSAGRPAVTYREVRASHQVRWTVLLDGTVRISILSPSAERSHVTYGYGLPA